MPKADYSKAAFSEALLAAGVKKSDIIFGHSNIGFFGFPEEGREPQRIVEVILSAIFDVIGSDGTLVVPTFSYSFGKKEVFDLKTTPGIGGYFAESVRKLPNAIRSLDPSASVAGIGFRAKELCTNVPENSYGENCFWERLLEANARFCNFNFNATTTFSHYVERVCRVPYRFDKTFYGRVRVNGREEERASTIFVRKDMSDPMTEWSFERIDALAIESGKCRKVKVGKGFIKSMTVRDQLDLIKQGIAEDPNFLIKAGKKPGWPSTPHELGI